jgi:hypothetical protein
MFSSLDLSSLSLSITKFEQQLAIDLRWRERPIKSRDLCRRMAIVCKRVEMSATGEWSHREYDQKEGHKEFRDEVLRIQS